MAAFALCPACTAEYTNPANRRFHAEPIACPSCGPQLWLEMISHGFGRLPTGDALTQTATLLRRGAVIAVQGLGGFHLACDATSDEAVRKLRAAKARPDKPLAVNGIHATGGASVWSDFRSRGGAADFNSSSNCPCPQTARLSPLGDDCTGQCLCGSNASVYAAPSSADTRDGKTIGDDKRQSAR